MAFKRNAWFLALAVLLLLLAVTVVSQTARLARLLPARDNLVSAWDERRCTPGYAGARRLLRQSPRSI
jgi:hypothetical protein